jgi:hypothetical protein
VPLQLRSVGDDGPGLGAEAIRPLDPGADRRETIGLSLDAAKAVRAGPKVRTATR